MNAMSVRKPRLVSGLLALLLGLGLVAGVYSLWFTPENSTPDRQKLRVWQSYGQLPLYFIENRGQVDSRVKFYEKAGQALYFTQEGVYFTLRKPEKAGKACPDLNAPQGNQEKGASPAVLRLTPLGMRPGVNIEAVEQGKPGSITLSATTPNNGAPTFPLMGEWFTGRPIPALT